MEKLYSDWLATLAKEPFESMSKPGQVDYVLFESYLKHAH